MASTFPAGHNWPPHPSFRSDSRIRGGSRRPEKSRDILAGRLGGIDGTSSSESMKDGLSDLEFSLHEDVILGKLCFRSIILAMIANGSISSARMHPV